MDESRDPFVNSDELPPSSGDRISSQEDPRELFRLQVLEDLEDERALLYRFVAIGLLLSLAILLRQVVLRLMDGAFF
ncbi:MAG: hypothetical protein MK135_14230 [Polyangiaceae bacterium]|nr:hypothetical protein [Polyangiaceae bacterium]